MKPKGLLLNNYMINKVIYSCLLSFVCFYGIGCKEKVQFGKEITQENSITVDSLVSLLPTGETKQVKVKGKISDACKMEGCWLELSSSQGLPILVTYKEEAFTLPLEIQGKEVVIEGLAYRDSLTIEDLRKEAIEEGKPQLEIEKINSPAIKLGIEADGVLLLPK